MQTITGDVILLQANTICFYGDGRGVVSSTYQLRQAMVSVNIRVCVLNAKLDVTK